MLQYVKSQISAKIGIIYENLVCLVPKVMNYVIIELLYFHISMKLNHAFFKFNIKSK